MKAIAILLVLVIAGGVFGHRQLQADTFTDVSHDYAFSAIERWAGYGVIQGRGNRIFDPYNNTTRAEFATMINNIMGYTTEAEPSVFTDIPNNSGMNGSVLRATYAGVFSPGGAFRPAQSITRVEAATAMLNMLGISFNATDTTPTHFTDDASFTPAMRGAIRAAYNHGLIRGFPVINADGSRSYRFGPSEHIMRKHLALLFDNVIGALVQNSSPLTRNVNGFVIITYPNATIRNASITGNIIITESAADGTVTLANTGVDGTVLSHCANISLNLSGEYRNLVFSGLARTLTIQGDNASVSITPNSHILDLVVFGQDVTISNNGEIYTAHLHAPIEECVDLRLTQPENVVIFETLPALSIPALPTYQDPTEETAAPTTASRPSLNRPTDPVPGTGSNNNNNNDSGSSGGSGGGSNNQTPQQAWRTMTAGRDYTINVETLENAIAFIVIEIPNTQNASRQWTAGTARVNQYRFRINGATHTFHRVNLDNVYQYRLALDISNINFSAEASVQVQMFR